MDMMSIGDDMYVSFGDDIELKWEKHWVHLLVTQVAGENISQVSELGWFSLSQILGDDVWQFLIARNEHESARRCFEYLIKTQLPIKQISKDFKGTSRYKVIH